RAVGAHQHQPAAHPRRLPDRQRHRRARRLADGLDSGRTGIFRSLCAVLPLRTVAGLADAGGHLVRIGETSKVLIIIYTTVFIVLINTMAGVSHIAPNKLRAAACLGATPLKAFIFVTLPATLPFILTGMRLAMGNSFATVIAAEMIAADSGLGFLIFNSRLWMATDKIFIGIVCLGALGLTTDRFFRYLIVRFAHQYGPIE